MKRPSKNQVKLVRPLPLLTGWLIVTAGLVPVWASQREQLQGALSALEKNRYPEAMRILDRSLREAQESGDQAAIGRLHFYLGLALQQQAEAAGNSRADEVTAWLHSAREHYQYALKQLPDSSGTWHNLAQVCAKLERPMEAAGAFQKAISLADERQVSYTVHYADFLFGCGRRKEGVRFYDVALEAQPTNERAFKALFDYYAHDDTARLGEFLRKHLGRGQVIQVLDAATSALEQDSDRLGRRRGEELLTVVVGCLTRLSAQPEHFFDTPAAGRLKALLGGRWATPVREVISLYEEGFAERRYEWWSQRTGSSSDSPPEGWPLDAFNSLIRALGDRSQRQNDNATAEAYYMLAANMNPQSPDGKALVKVADLYARTDQRDKLEQLLVHEHELFGGKGRAYEMEDDKKIYEYHRSLGILYSHLGSWGSSEDVRSATYQLEHALQIAMKYNEDRGRSQGSELIVEPRLVNLLDSRYRETNEARKAFELRTMAARNYRETGAVEAATKVFQPIAQRPVPVDVNDRLLEEYETLQGDFDPSGFKTTGARGTPTIPRILPIVPAPSPKEILSEVHTDSGVLRVRQPRDGSLSRSEMARISESLQALIAESQTWEASDKRFRFLPPDFPDDVVSVEFDGKQGTVLLRRQPSAVEVPFMVEPVAGSKTVPFKAVRR